MAFDQPIRARLQRFVTDVRCILEEEFTRQLQTDYGMDPASGTVSSLEELRHITEQQRETARILRETLAHYCAAPGTDARVGLDRIVREQAFTVLNRLAALRMAEARGLLIESVGSGYQARGFQLYSRLTGGGLGETGDAYRAYLLSVFDELAQDLPSLFDRYSPQGRLFPREAALLPVLELINHGEIEPLWAEDETIGWIYQYFNSKEERKAMRDASQAPRNSRELAVRNQFFTPRYVVELLVDNTLGRLWFNWMGGQTVLRNRCQYLSVKPDKRSESAERLRDPRTIKLLDPACGSMHFGLYAFDLFLEIYREAWAWEQAHGPGSLDTAVGGGPDLTPLSQTYADQNAFLFDVPRLIIERNIYGVDIDPRAAQIASLALWLRAQRAWHEAGVKANDRPQVGQGQVVAAVAPPAEVDMRERFMEELDPLDAELFEQTLFMLKDLPELGVLLQVEKSLPALIRKVFGERGPMFSEEDMAQWQTAESRLREALADYARAAQSTYQGRLFAEDALQGLRMIDHCREAFDVVVMNPPFGATSSDTKTFVSKSYPSGKGDLLAVFVERALNLLRTGGLIGAITSRAPFFLGSMENWRKEVVLGIGRPVLFVDLGMGVMDDAMVEAAAYIIGNTFEPGNNKVDFIRALTSADKAEAIKDAGADSGSCNHYKFSLDALIDSPGSAFAYWIKEETLLKLGNRPTIEQKLVSIRVGMQTGNDWRFLRQWWEVQSKSIVAVDEHGVPKPAYEELGQRWVTYTKTDRASPWFSPLLQVVKWEKQGAEYDHFLNESGKCRSALRSKELYFKPGFSYMLRSARLVPYIVPAGAIPTAGRAQGFGEGDELLSALVIAASNLGSSWARLTGEMFERPKFQAGMVQSIPAINFTEMFLKSCRELVAHLYSVRRSNFDGKEPHREFSRPEFFRQQLSDPAWERRSLLGVGMDHELAEQYQLNTEEYNQLQRDLIEAIEFQQNAIDASVDDNESDQDSSDGEVQEESADEKTLAEGLISYAFGACFGRWDIRRVLNDTEAKEELDPFRPVPRSPPGWLQWDELSMDEQSAYPLSISDGGLIEHQTSGPSQLVVKITDCLDILSSFKTVDEGAVCASLHATSVSDYLGRSSGFFAMHLDMYSGGGRRAPIYWPLSTSSGNYMVWVYYPSLTNQTLYTAVNDFVEPKLDQVSRDIATLVEKGAARSRDDEKSLEELRSFELELVQLRDALMAIAPTYRPNHDDGVQITAAPLWQFFRHKVWQKVLKDTWAKLEKGDYDWAHLAMSYWPERVREKCRTDKSLAIAHGLEHLYVEPAPQPVGGRGRKKGDVE